MLDDNRSGKGYIDLAGKFPFVSNRAHQYILVAYNYDANHISAMPIKNRESASIERAWKVLNAEFEKAGVAPETYISICITERCNAYGKYKVPISTTTQP